MTENRSAHDLKKIYEKNVNKYIHSLNNNNNNNYYNNAYSPSQLIMKINR